MNWVGSLLVLGTAFVLMRKNASAPPSPGAPSDGATNLGELPPVDISFGGDAAMGGAVIAVPSAPPPGIVPYTAPDEPLAASPMPGIIPFMQPRAIGERRALASRLAEHLCTTTPGTEDRDLVAAFQAQEGMRPSGFYSASTALRLAKGYGIVPPRPRYWTKTDTKRSKRRYAAELDRLASRDRQRSEEWQRARP